MHRILTLGLFGILILTPLSAGSPIDGTFSQVLELRDEVFTTTKTFRGGERAAALAFVTGEAPGNIQLAVYNKTNELVAQDKSDDGLAGSIVGVAWYPAEDGAYRIEVRHPTARKIYVAIK